MTTLTAPPPGFDPLRDLGYTFDPPFPPTSPPTQGGAPATTHPVKTFLRERVTERFVKVASLLWGLLTTYLFYSHFGPSYAVGMAVLTLLFWLMVRGVASSSRKRKVTSVVFLAGALLLLGWNLTGLFFLTLAALSFYASFLRSGHLWGVRESGGGPVRFSGTTLADFQAACVPTWGVPGGNIATAAHFGTAGQRGQEGEVRVGKALNKLQESYPHLRVFHGLRWMPNSNKPWDVDHLVLIGQCLYFIDAKEWAYGSYQWVGPGRVLKDGQEERAVGMGDAMGYWKQYLPRNVVMVARITLAQPQATRYIVSPQGNQGPVRLVTLAEVLGELEQHARSSEPVVDRRLVAALASQLI